MVTNCIHRINQFTIPSTPVNPTMDKHEKMLQGWDWPHQDTDGKDDRAGAWCLSSCLNQKLLWERAPFMTQLLAAGGALGTNAAPSQGPIRAPQGLWHGHIKAMPTVLWRKIVAKFCLLCLLTPTETLWLNPWLDFLTGFKKTYFFYPLPPQMLLSCVTYHWSANALGGILTSK